MPLLFSTYSEALSHYNADINHSVNIVDHPKSFERIVRGGGIIYCLGTGMKSSPGYPCGNQCISSQAKFCRRPNTDGKLPVFHTHDGRVEYMGKYIVLGHTKKMSYSGFTYFEYMLYRVEHGDDRPLITSL